MPLYDYFCPDCREGFEKRVPAHKRKQLCPKCKRPLTPKIAAVPSTFHPTRGR